MENMPPGRRRCEDLVFPVLWEVLGKSNIFSGNFCQFRARLGETSAILPEDLGNLEPLKISNPGFFKKRLPFLASFRSYEKTPFFFMGFFAMLSLL